MFQDQPLQIAYEGDGLRLIGKQDDRQPLESLGQLAKLAGALEKGTRDTVRRARAAGHSWVDIGEALGISKQAAWERFGTS